MILREQIRKFGVVYSHEEGDRDTYRIVFYIRYSTWYNESCPP